MQTVPLTEAVLSSTGGIEGQKIPYADAVTGFTGGSELLVPIPDAHSNTGGGKKMVQAETRREAIMKAGRSKECGKVMAAVMELLANKKFRTWQAVSRGVNRLTVVIYPLGNAFCFAIYMWPLVIRYIEHFYVVDYLDDV